MQTTPDKATPIHFHKSLDPDWPRWAVSGKTPNTQWFKTLAEAANEVSRVGHVRPGDWTKLRSALTTLATIRNQKG